MFNKSEKIKRKRTSISLETKIKILNRLASGEGSSSVGKVFNVNESTIRNIKKNEAAIRKSIISGTSPSTKYSSYSRDDIVEKTERVLVMWIEENSQKRIPLDGNTIRQKAMHTYNKIKEQQPSTSSQSIKHDFSASKGWLTAFLKRHGLRNIKIKGEIGSGDTKAAQEFKSTLPKIIEDDGYTPDQVFNADETGLFWKKMPSRTYVAKSQKSAGGFKAAKDRVTLLFCSNASGDRMLKPLLINHSLRPRAMKNVDINTLPVHWKANKKAWVTTALFTEWFNECFLPEVKIYLEEKGLEFKVLLILDNAPSHPHLEHPNVKLLFLPPNTTSLIQPLDQGIIATFKSYYIKETFQYILNKLDENKTLTVIDVWKKFSILDCVKYIDLALTKLKSSTMNACWKAVWPECIKSDNVVPSCTTEYPNIISLANAVGGEGFEDLAFEDIDELMTDAVLDEEELINVVLGISDCGGSKANEEDISFSASLIQEGIQLAEKLEHHFVPNICTKKCAIPKDFQELYGLLP